MSFPWFLSAEAAYVFWFNVVLLESTFAQINLKMFNDSAYLLRGYLKLLHNYSRIQEPKSIVWLPGQMFLIKVVAEQGSLLPQV